MKFFLILFFQAIFVYPAYSQEVGLFCSLRYGQTKQYTFFSENPNPLQLGPLSLVNQEANNGRDWASLEVYHSGLSVWGVRTGTKIDRVKDTINLSGEPPIAVECFRDLPKVFVFGLLERVRISFFLEAWRILKVSPTIYSGLKLDLQIQENENGKFYSIVIQHSPNQPVKRGTEILFNTKILEYAEILRSFLSTLDGPISNIPVNPALIKIRAQKLR